MVVGIPAAVTYNRYLHDMVLWWNIIDIKVVSKTTNLNIAITPSILGRMVQVRSPSTCMQKIDVEITIQ